MHGKLPRQLLLSLPAILVAAMICLIRFQLTITHALAVFYLFSGYILVAIFVFIGIWVVVFARQKWPGLLVMLVLAAAISSPAIRDYLKNAGTSDGPRLRVITYNWLGDGRDRSAIYEWIRQQNPDIMVIAEFSEFEKGVREQLFPIFPYHTRPARDVIILSRYPVVKERSEMIVDHAIVTAKVNIAGQFLNVWGIHPSTLRTSPELAARNDYLARLSEMMRPQATPLLMMGDFNATRWDPHFENLVRQGDLHEEPRLFPLATRMGVRSRLPFIGSPIDHILTNSGNRLSGCHTGPALGSDHLPLICDLQISGKAT